MTKPTIAKTAPDAALSTQLTTLARQLDGLTAINVLSERLAQLEARVAGMNVSDQLAVNQALLQEQVAQLEWLVQAMSRIRHLLSDLEDDNAPEVDASEGAVPDVSALMASLGGGTGPAAGAAALKGLPPDLMKLLASLNK